MRELFLAVSVMFLGCGLSSGDPCAFADEGKGACSADGKQFLECSGGRFTGFDCPGPRHCEDSSRTVAVCDFAGAKEGDPCPAQFSGRAGFCLDSKTLLTCKGTRFVSQPCRECGWSGATDANGFKLYECQQ